MAYNRVGTPKFFIDAMLLARQLGYIALENPEGKFYLNPTNYSTVIDSDEDNSFYYNIHLSNRFFLNSLTHCFILGHQLSSANLRVKIYIVNDDPYTVSTLLGTTDITNNGFSKFDFDNETSIQANRFTVKIDSAEVLNSVSLGDISTGWSYAMNHSPDLELTQTFSNESLKTQTTKGGHSLSNVGWSQPPKWGDFPAWRKGASFVAYPMRRSWNLKFSYLSDLSLKDSSEDSSENVGLFPQYYNEIDSGSNNRGIFERTETIVDDPATLDVDETAQMFSIKNDFLSKVMPTINLGLPFIFQPNQEVEEYAICKVDNDSISFNMVANNVYDISINLVEVW